MASVLERLEPPARLSLYLRLYNQIVSPVVASSAATLPPGSDRYITPSYTVGMVSVTPPGNPFDQASPSCRMLPRLIWSSGLKRCASGVRLNHSQSLGEGFSSIASVTGVKRVMWGMDA